MFGIRDDEDLRKDPVMQIDMNAHVKAFFVESGSKEEFRRDVEQLNVEEMVCFVSSCGPLLTVTSGYRAVDPWRALVP